MVDFTTQHAILEWAEADLDYRVGVVFLQRFLR